MVEDIISRKHYVLPGVEITISQAALYKWIAAYKKEGFNGLVPKYYVREKPATNGNTVKINIQINMKNPLASLKRLRDIIAMSASPAPETKAVSLKFLDDEIEMLRPGVAKYKPRWLNRSLTEDEVRKLEAYKVGHNQKRSNRATAILMANVNHTMLEIMMETGASHQSIYKWLQRFEEEGVGFIEAKRHHPEKEKLLATRKTRIIEILHGLPMLYGINRASWTYEAIALAYNQTYEDSISRHMVKRAIKSTGYSWRHARTVLTSHDPLYREKTAKVLDALRNLKEGEAFFFIDEAGPYAVKQYGGKALTPSGTTRIVPQYQKTRGSVSFIAALEALTNQVTWTFIRTKNISNVKALLEILQEKYASHAKLYVTWDAVSWHISDRLVEWARKSNAEHLEKNSGPLVELLPLPVNSQFLNVIEAVFSGMKKAVIFNSNYASEEEMKTAISRHFEERNEYFKENPKRAGNKIWDKEFFNTDEIQGGLFKKM